MSEPFLAEIRMVGFDFAPRGWALCDGQLLPIDQNQSLYSLLGTTYGGDGETTFALPEMRGRTPVHVGSDGNGPSYSEGQLLGEESHALTTAEMPEHDHLLRATSAPGDTNVPTDNTLAATHNAYGSATELVELRSGTVGTVGLGQAHGNMQPFLAVNFCIAIRGLFPSS